MSNQPLNYWTPTPPSRGSRFGSICFGIFIGLTLTGLACGLLRFLRDAGTVGAVVAKTLYPVPALVGMFFGFDGYRGALFYVLFISFIQFPIYGACIGANYPQGARTAGVIILIFHALCVAACFLC